MADEYGYRFTFEEIEGSAPPLPFNTPQDGDPPPPYEQFLSHAPQYAPSSSVVPDDFRAAPSIPANVPPPSYGVATFRRIPQAPFKLEPEPDGVSCSDPRLNEDPQELLNFFIANNKKPGMQVVVWGHHQERRKRTVTRNGKSHTESHTVFVSDFKTSIDVSEWIQSGGTIHTVPGKEDCPVKKSLLEVLTEYIECGNSFKEIHMRKHCVWDYAELSTVIHAAVRQVGFRKQITISYPMMEHTVKVKSSSKLARTARDPCVKLLCIMTCLWVVFLPIYCCIRKIFRNSVRSDFAMTITPMQFFQMNYWTIVGGVKNRYGTPLDPLPS